MKCEKEVCNNERVCFHYCHDHHQEICMAGVVNHSEITAAQQSVQQTAFPSCPKCGAKVSFSWRKCGACGYRRRLTDCVSLRRSRRRYQVKQTRKELQMDDLTELVMQVCDCTSCYENNPCEKVLKATERIRKINVAAQQSVYPTGGSLPPSEVWSTPEGMPTPKVNLIPPTSG